MNPLVSILIPAYNSQEWISETIKSALEQTWPRKEIIIVDDGSTDQTLAMAKQFATNGVTVVTQKNEGAAAARNHAFSLSHGDYIQWLDADDLLAPDKIAKQMNSLGSTPDKRVLLSSSWARFLNRPRKAIFMPSPLWCDLSPAEWMARKLESNVYMQTATWLTSRELAEAAGPWDTRLLGDDDGEYFSRVQLQSKHIQFVPEAKVFYRIAGAGGLSYVGQSQRKLVAHLLSVSLHVQYLRSIDTSERARKACLAYLQTNLCYFYPEWPELVEQVNQIASSLGGQLEIPRLSWKYAWIQQLFGWAAASRTQLRYNRTKMSVRRTWDKALSRLEKSSG